MANTYVNKVVIGNQTQIDLTSTTAVESDVAQGKVFFKANGEQATGIASGGGTSDLIIIDTPDINGGTIRTITSTNSVRIGIGKSENSNILNMFDALEKGTVHSGTFMLSKTLPNKDTFLFDTGFSDPNGWAVFDTEYDQEPGMNNYSVFQLWIVSKTLVPYNRISEYTYACLNVNENGTNSSTNAFGGASCIKVDGSVAYNHAYWTLTDGKLYAKGNYNSSPQYTPFRELALHRWIAW